MTRNNGWHRIFDQDLYIYTLQTKTFTQASMPAPPSSFLIAAAITIRSRAADLYLTTAFSDAKKSDCILHLLFAPQFRSDSSIWTLPDSPDVVSSHLMTRPFIPHQGSLAPFSRRTPLPVSHTITNDTLHLAGPYPRQPCHPHLRIRLVAKAYSHLPRIPVWSDFARQSV